MQLFVFCHYEDEYIPEAKQKPILDRLVKAGLLEKYPGQNRYRRTMQGDELYDIFWRAGAREKP
jgi:hypothetical protein